MDMEDKQVLTKWLLQRITLADERKQFMLGVSRKFAIDGYASYERGLADGEVSAANSELRFITDLIREMENM